MTGSDRARAPSHVIFAGLACAGLLACSQGAGGTAANTSFTSTTATATATATATGTGTGTAGSSSSGTSAGSGSGSSGSGSGNGTGPLLDTPNDSGCTAVDLLFVIDNSESMSTYQQALTQAFPGFVQAMYDTLPSGLSVHVGITTTDFDTGCTEPEATSMCQSTASADTILMHYVKPTDFNDGGNGSQGRLFEFDGMRFFASTTDDDPGPLVTWFSGAATSAGENGCSFEMPVAAAGWAADPANAATNDGFIRDAGALLVVFYLTDEPDKSPESKTAYADKLRATKVECGGDTCIFMAGLIPPCVSDVNQKLWQVMKLFADDPPWSDIADTANYGNLVGQALADAVASACMMVPPVG